MAMHGSNGELHGGQKSWKSYSERLEHYFVAKDVKSAMKKRAILLSRYGLETYMLVRNLVAPRKPTKHSFTELVELVRTHHNP